MSLVKGIYNRFKSVKTTALIFGSLIVVYFAGLVIPQKGLFSSYNEYQNWLQKSLLYRLFDQLSLTDIYLSPITIVLLVLFFLNLIVVVGERTRVVLKKVYITSSPALMSPDDIKKKNSHLTIEMSGSSESVIMGVLKTLKRNRWKVISFDKGGRLFAMKNRLSPFGFVLFHLSFLFCLVGGLLITYTRFYGYLTITEGQRLADARKHITKVVRKPKILKELPYFGLSLIRVEPHYKNDVPTDLFVYLDVLYNGRVKREVLKVNEPVKRGALSLVVQDIWLAPLMVLRDEQGRMLDGAYVALNLLHGQWDSFWFDTLKGYRFHALFFPDYVEKNGIESTKSIVIRNPALHLRVEKDGKPISEGTLKPGEFLRFANYSISFDGYRYSVYLNVIREYGKVPLIAGFVLALAGLLMRLIFYQKRLWVAVSGADGSTEVLLYGRSEYFNLSFSEELRSLSERIRETVK
ncbi:MAG: hypothetical protein D6710_06180 [Nitrospirae bacterium]|nr:MAG: hypothetical protein D6710_06180 [Nitrospirota bacterium]